MRDCIPAAGTAARTASGAGRVFSVHQRRACLLQSTRDGRVSLSPPETDVSPFKVKNAVNLQIIQINQAKVAHQFVIIST